SLFSVVAYIVRKANLTLPEKKVSSVRNRGYSVFYSTIVTISLFHQFFFRDEDASGPLTPYQLFTIRFINGYHFFHILEMKYYGILTYSVISHHIGVLIITYYSVYADLQNFLCYCKYS